MAKRPRSETSKGGPPKPGSPCLEASGGELANSEFGEIYTEHSRAIFYLCLRFLSDPQKAEDATHDVFLKAFRKMDSFRGDSSWRTWLYRITINHSRNLQQTWNARHTFTNADEASSERATAKTDSPLRRPEP